MIVVAQAGTAAAATADYVCDGSGDEIEINAAIGELAIAGGGTLQIAGGFYSIDRPVVVYDDNIHITGEGAEQTIIQPSDDWHAIQHPVSGNTVTGAISFVGVDNFSCEKLTVDATAKGTICNGIIAIPDGVDGAGTPCSNGVIADNAVFLVNAHAYHIWSLRGSHMEITGNYVDGGRAPGAPHPSQEGIELYGGTDVTIANNIVKNIGSAGLWPSPSQRKPLTAA